MKTRVLLVLPLAVMGGCEISLNLSEYDLKDGALCQDGIKNQDETGTDCGGSCAACADNTGCMVGTDCASLVCEGNLCRAPSCKDGIRNGDELGVDCRGACIDQKCAAGEFCQSNIDCIGGECVNEACVANCKDGATNGNESGIDCGGPECVACGNGEGCGVNGDCESEVCDQSLCIDSHRFSKGFGEVQSLQFFTSTMMVDSKSDDRIAVGGSLIGSVDFGLGYHVTLANDYSNVYLAQFDGSGNCLWSKSFGDALYPQIASALSVNTNGDIAITGFFLGPLDFGGGILSNDTSKTNSFIAVINSKGDHVWSRSVGGTEDDKASGVSINDVGEVISSGVYSGTNINMGGKTISSSANSVDIYLVRHKNDGTALWAKSFGDAGVQHEPILAENKDGITVLAGKLTGKVSFGGNELSAPANMETIYIAALSKQGSHLWSKSFSHTIANNTFYINDAAIDDNQNITIIGTFTTSVSFDSTQLSSKGKSDIFVAQFDPTGTLKWAKSFGNTDFDEAKALDVTPDGSLLITGTFINTIDFGGHLLSAQGDGSSFILKLSPNGDHVWSRALGSNKNVAFPDVSPLGPNNKNIVTTALYNGILSYGGPTLPEPANAFSFALAGLTLPIQ